MSDRLEIINATTHNLKNVSLSIPKNTLTVVTGVSGSGKSSLAFDTIYALGQQKYLESLSTYARMIVSWGEQEAQVEEIRWLSPTISINQKTVSANPRSTVGTITEIYDYLRLLYATIGVQYCPNHPDTPLVKQTVGDVESKIDTFADGLKLMILSPLDYESEITFHQLEERVVREGFVRYSIGDNVYQVGDHANDTTVIDMSTSPYIAIVIDRLMTGNVLRDDLSKRKRLRDSVALAFRVGIERMALMIEWQGVVDIFHSQASCSDCGYSAQSLSLRDFSFNSHHGACPDCHGLGMKTDFIEEMVVNPRLTLAEWALLPWAGSTYYMPVMIEFAHHMEIPTNVAYHTLTKKQRHLILNTKGVMITLRQPLRGFSGTVRENIKYEWLLTFLRRKFSEWSDKDAIYKKIIGYATETICPLCDGYRLKESSLFVRITTMHIGQMAALSVRELIDFFATYVAPPGMQEVVDKILKNIIERLDFLSGVGLEYVTLDRRAQTLSGGEAQRIRLATQIWSKLEGVIYVLDEPSIGLHSRDNDLLIANLHKLANLGNTVIVVEHDEDIMRACDYIIDIWPRAGVHGWQIVAQGTYDEIIKNSESDTALYLSGRKHVNRDSYVSKFDEYMSIKNARENNLQSLNVDIPTHGLTMVTGVSGSWKSSLIMDTLAKFAESHFARSPKEYGKCDGIDGIEVFEKAIIIDQSPIGKTPHSNIATYTGVFTLIREVFAASVDAQKRWFAPGRFSFNTRWGRCEHCEWSGTKKIEMYFLPDVYSECEQCHGTRYNQETLEVTFKGKNIADILSMTVEDALTFFTAFPRISRVLQVLFDVGLWYITLGQWAPTLSGGEAQRIKLAFDLAKRSNDKTLYILDEPTTGLHFSDVQKLLDILSKLVDRGNAVVVIEHNLDMIAHADWIVDIGPSGGKAGGQLLYSWPFREFLSQESATSRALHRYFGYHPNERK